jgi:hypothetical protein
MPLISHGLASASTARIARGSTVPLNIGQDLFDHSTVANVYAEAKWAPPGDGALALTRPRQIIISGPRTSCFEVVAVTSFELDSFMRRGRGDSSARKRKPSARRPAAPVGRRLLKGTPFGEGYPRTTQGRTRSRRNSRLRGNPDASPAQARFKVIENEMTGERRQLGMWQPNSKTGLSRLTNSSCACCAKRPAMKFGMAWW